jgi:hypothetical protein
VTSDRRQDVLRLYHLSLARDPHDRRDFLDEACAGHEDLRAEIEAPLAQEPPSDFLPSPTDMTPSGSQSGSATAAPFGAGQVHFDPGASLGPYRIDAPVGAGGMGEVFRATDTRLNRSVAIKVLRAGIALDPQVRLRFDREAKAVAALTHPHICTLYDVGRHEDVDFLVMEYIEGETLAARLARERPPFEDALA